MELFGFFAAGPTQSYAREVIQQRGTSFTPDQDFISAFSAPVAQQTLRGVKARSAASSSPDRDSAYVILRRAYQKSRQKQYVEAAEDFRLALQLAPDSATLHLAYAASCLLSQNFETADGQARQSIKLWPENAEAYGVLALALIAEKQFAEAAESARQALAIYPSHPSAKFELGLALARGGQFQEAIPVLRDALTAMPSMTMLRKWLGISLMETGDLDGSIDQLTQYVKVVVPTDPEGYYFLGVALRQKGRTEEAHQQFLEALRLQPGNPQFEVAAHPNAASTPASASAGPKPEDNVISGNVYTNKFFGLTYEFPKGWNVLSPDASKALNEIGSNLLSTGDPTEADIKKAAEKNGRELLFVMERQAPGQPIAMKSVRINALDTESNPQLLPKEFLVAISERLKRSALPIQIYEPLHQTQFGGRTFWNETIVAKVGAGDRYVSYSVTAEKGFLVTFLVDTPDPASLVEIQKSFDTIHFADAAN